MKDGGEGERKAYGCRRATMQIIQMKASMQKIVTEKAKVLKRVYGGMLKKHSNGWNQPGINKENGAFEPMDNGSHCPSNSNSKKDIHLNNIMMNIGGS